MTGMFILALTLAIIAYWSGLSEAVSRWMIQEEYSHGFLIPLVTLFILWEKRHLISSAMGPPMWSGVVLIFIALGIFFVGEISALYLLIQYSFILVLLGLSMITVGKATKYTYVPILLLLFAIPLPYVVEVLLTAKLQLFSSWIGVQVIRLFQIPVFLEGNIIDLGVYKLQVVEACSGLRYLFPLMSLGFIAAYFYQAAFWKRATVFLMTIPITILMNSFRIGVIGVMVDNWGISMAEGFLHDFEGWIIFMACAALLFLLVVLLEKIAPSRKTLSQLFGVVDHAPSNNMFSINSKPYSYKPFIVVILILIIALFSTKFVDNREEEVPAHEGFISFPLQFTDWIGQHDKLDERVIDQLGMSDYLFVNYTGIDRNVVNLYVAYYETQRKGVSPHSPRVCIPGGGWEIADFRRDEVNGHPINRVVIKNGDQEQLVYYWFQGRGRIIANEYSNKWYLFNDAILENRTDGALVRYVTPVSPGETLKDADARIKLLMDQTGPELKRYIAD
jgi:exosortase D (VPLPA-CTERM-specific)|tara:strand:+ start:69219 stop:70730 length:1512 start_codon:yes stop_codon:yes gene_type:complete